MYRPPEHDLRDVKDAILHLDRTGSSGATSRTGGEPALLPALLVGHGQEVLYMPGRLVNRASDGYRDEGKTDARDAYVIADQARMRRDLRPIRPGDDAAIELLTGRRADLVEDRTRVVNRLRGTLLSMCPGSAIPHLPDGRLRRHHRLRGRSPPLLRQPCRLRRRLVQIVKRWLIR